MSLDTIALQSYIGSLHCNVTRNQCGTDTRPIGAPCGCDNCAFYEQISKLQAEVEQLRRENICDVCCGKGNPGTGKPCVCGGTGMASRQAQGFRESINDLHKLLEHAEQRCEALEARLKDCAKMLRRGMKACERQGWEKGESTEAWYHAAGHMAGIIEIHAKDAAISAQAAGSNSGDAHGR